MSSNAAQHAIDKAAWQPKIFAASLRRSELIALKPSWPCRSLSVRVHRNMPFEFVASVLPAFLAYAGFEAAVSLSDYDDALNFSADVAAVDCEIVWLDFSRYAGRLDDDALFNWLKERLLALRELGDAPILVADGGGASLELNRRLAEFALSVPGLRVFPRQQVQDDLGVRWIDTRMKTVGANSMSDEAVIAVARLFGLVWLPGAIETALKAVVLDLDNTLYAGVLGEDGSAGVVLSPEHRAFQEKILALKKQGLFLALLSRNERSDVEKLFAARSDFPLRWDDFSAVSIDWDDKSQGLRRIAEQLRIHTDAMLVIDDNLGEIAEMAAQHATASFWHAADPALSQRALGLFPRLLRWHRSGDTDRLRARDLEATRVREELMAGASDPKDYMRSLGVVLGFRLDPQDLRERLTDLANKTNQFVLSLARFDEVEVARRLSDPRCATFAVSLADRLSDSGVIAAIFCRAEDRTLVVDEICISCRALGRHMEDIMIFSALDAARKQLGTETVVFAYNRGPRNDPARQWLARATGAGLADEQGLRVLDPKRLGDFGKDVPVEILWEATEKAA